MRLRHSRLNKITFLFALVMVLLISYEAVSEVIEVSPTQDTFVNSKKANNSYGSNSYIRLRESKKVDRHGLIKFDLNEIPDGSEIQSAKLSVFVTYKRSFNNILTVYEALEGWSESTKWSNKPSMSSLSEDSVSIGSGGVYYELDVTGIVQDWVDGAADNNGLYLIVSNGHIYINSSENSSNQPILNITYNSSETEPAPEPAPEPEPPPSGGAVLTELDPGREGLNKIQVMGAPRGAVVKFKYAFSEGTKVIPGSVCAGEILDLKKPKSFGKAIANEEGTATLNVNLNGSFSGKTLHVQARVETKVCEITNKTAQFIGNAGGTTPPPPAPEPEPVPEPEPNPGPGELVPDTGVSDAPLFPANKRVLVVSKDGSGKYNSISDAIEDAVPGDTIQVKDGIYVERVHFTVNGTRDLPIALVNYPGHKPIIDPGGGEYPPECCPSGGTPRVEVNAEWIIIEGFEIRYGWDGIKLYKGHNTIRGNWIHRNKYTGILAVSTSDVFIHKNTIEHNGTEEGSCTNPSTGVRSSKHCHAIYLSEYFCNGMANNTIRGNLLSNHGGRGVQWNASHCGAEGVIRNTLVENNIFENNSWGMVMYHNVESSIVINNTFVIEDYPSTNDVDHTFVGIYGSVNNIFMNNIFQSSRDDVMGIAVVDFESMQNSYDHNLWNVKYERWVWGGNWRNDFQNYQIVSGWDGNGITDSEAGFFDLTGGDYHITSSSKAKNNGNNKYCALGDIDNEPRIASADDVCDIGADEEY